MHSINKITLIGNIGEEGLFQPTRVGGYLYLVDLYTNEYYIDGDGNKQVSTEKHRIKMYNKSAEVANNLINKGDYVYIEGRLQYHDYGDRVVAEIRAEKFIKLN